MIASAAGWWILGGWCVMAFVLLVVFKREMKKAIPLEEDALSMIEEVNQMIGRATHHREQLGAIAERFVQLHGYTWNSCDGEDLAGVIFDGDNYEIVLKRIMNRRKNLTS